MKSYQVSVQHYDKATSTRWGKVHHLNIKARTPKEATAKANSISDAIAISAPVLQYNY